MEQKSNTWEENKHIIDNVGALSCTNFTDADITEEMFIEAKVIRLGKIADDLCKKVMELEAQVKPITPPKVLEERRKSVAEDVKKIEEAEALCSKAVDQVSYTWEALIDDAELE